MHVYFIEFNIFIILAKVEAEDNLSGEVIKPDISTTE